MRSKDLLPPRFLVNQDMLIGIRIKAEMKMPSLTQVPDDGTKILNSIPKLQKRNESDDSSYMTHRRKECVMCIFE